MITDFVRLRLENAFPDSFVNHNYEFIAHKRANEYFRLEDCETELDVKCKVLEWFSRGAYKTEPFHFVAENNRFHSFMLKGINKFLGTKFTEDDMELIYSNLGNRCNHQRTIRFVESGYDMNVLFKESEDTE
mgnify:CR=1 FL=1